MKTLFAVCWLILMFWVIAFAVPKEREEDEKKLKIHSAFQGKGSLLINQLHGEWIVTTENETYTFKTWDEVQKYLSERNMGTVEK